MTLLKALFVFALAVVVNGCASDQCNNVPQRPVNPIAQTDTPAPQRTMQSSSAVIPDDGIQVSKPTGEKQCSVGKPVPISDMLSQFSSKNIKVYESHTQADGLVHTDLCGAPGGNVNIFTISKKDLKKAQNLGFKEVKK